MIKNIIIIIGILVLLTVCSKKNKYSNSVEDETKLQQIENNSDILQSFNPTIEMFNIQMEREDVPAPVANAG